MADARPSPRPFSQLAKRIPPGTWDTHMHVVEPEAFPLAADALYKPSPHTLADARAFLSGLGIQKMVIVQPSIYGNDNSCTLAGLRGLGPANGRAVVQFDPDVISDDQLREWHGLGVRGVRLNFKSVGAQVEAAALERSLGRYAEAVGDLGWVLELYIALEDVPMLEQMEPRLGGVKICIDHLGHPSTAALASARSAHDLAGLSSLLKLLARGKTWIKLSATYRLSKDPYHPVVESLCRELIRCAPHRCVFASDWPHTRYEGLDVSRYLDAVLGWINDEGVDTRRVCVDNAEELFGIGQRP